MSTQSFGEFQRIRAALLPAVENLGEAAEVVPNRTGFSDQTRTDIEKLLNYAKEFQRAATLLFPFQILAQSEEEAAVMLKNSRHDSRNHLNHLFQLLDILALAKEYSEIQSSLSYLSGRANFCLEILNTPVSALESGLLRSGDKFVLSSSDETSPVIPEQSKGLLLIADDDKENRDLLARLLRDHGHGCDTAENGAEAIEMINKKRYDAVLLDIQMPVMDGFQVLEKLKESGHLRLTPVIVVTGLQGDQDAARCLEIGAEDFLSRPIRSTFLMAKIKACLEKKRLREAFFTQFFSPELALELARNQDLTKMQAREETVSLLFCDIRGFSSISEQLGPKNTVEWLGDVLGDLSALILDEGGVLVDYTGDELMGMWGAPNHQPDHAERACKVAIAIMEKRVELNRKWQDVVKAETSIGIGINTGPAMVGNIGTRRRFKYGPLGTSVNLASRVQGATKYIQVPLLITGETRKSLGPGHLTRKLCSVRVQNIRQPVDLYELVPPSIGHQEIWQSRTKIYEEALDLFEQYKLEDSMALLGNLVKETPDDYPCLLLISWVVEAMMKKRKKIPRSEFSPVWELSGK